MAITKGKVLRYTLLPGFIPRISAFVTSGFSHLSYYIALVYAMVRLLPPDHPYLQAQNIGKYGLRHVVAQAANNLVLSRKNIDQIVIFFTILAGLVLMFIQFFLLALALIAQQDAFASGINITDLFQNPNNFTNSRGPNQDIAFIILDRVFGLVGIYDSCVSTGVACENNRGIAAATSPASYPYPFHTALHAMLQFFSTGIAIIAALIIIYHVITIVGEAATTGTPFGQRFNKAWVPVRIVLFFAMLIPLNIGGTNGGLNGAQILTFWVAKHGSNFATNGWTYFSTKISEGYLQQSKLVAKPSIPEVGSLNQFMLISKTCSFAEQSQYGHTVIPYITRPQPPAYASPPSGPADSPNALNMMTTDYQTALAFVQRGDIRITFGVLGKDMDGDGIIEQYQEYPGNIFPYCGEMLIPTNAIGEPGANKIAEGYYKLILSMWQDSDNTRVAECLFRTYLNNPSHAPVCPDDLPDDYFAQLQNNSFQSEITAIIEEGIEEQLSTGEFNIPDELLEKGWAGAAVWFNRVAEMNGAVTTASFGVPTPRLYPYVLEEILKKRVQENADVGGLRRFAPTLADGEPITLPGGREVIHRPMYEAFTFWEQDNRAGSPETTPVGNAAIDTINLILGTSGIFEMRENANIHPMAQLTSLGRGMMEATVRNAGYATAAVVGGGILGIIEPFVGDVAKAASKFLFSVVTAAIGIAVILYYVLPFLPFIYFIFAVSGWVKSIFEAVVAMPLWALAHLKIDGDGIPGKDAASGYFLLLEIFLRPILILFGLLASLSIFGALVYTLNNIFDLVVSNVGGNNVRLEGAIEAGSETLPSMIEFYRGPIDVFFFTAVYAIIVYIMGLSCFKLVDQIPNNILRWAGSSVAAFQENAGDPAGALVGQVHKGSLLLANQIKGTAQGDLAIIVS